VSARKRWRVVWVPSGPTERVPSGPTERVPSSVRAYEAVNDQRKWIKVDQGDAPSGPVQFDAALVQFDDGDGFGWQTYERLDFRKKESP
jgi:hypothetical protein